MENTITAYEHLMLEADNIEMLCRLSYALNLSGCESCIDKSVYQVMFDVEKEITNLEYFANRTFTDAEKDFVRRVRNQSIKLTAEQKENLDSLEFMDCANDYFINYFLPIDLPLDEVNTLVGSYGDMSVKVLLRTLFGNDYTDSIATQLEALYGVHKLKSVLNTCNKIKNKAATNLINNQAFCRKAYEKRPDMSSAQLHKAVNDLTAQGVIDPVEILNRL